MIETIDIVVNIKRKSKIAYLFGIKISFNESDIRLYNRTNILHP